MKEIRGLKREVARLRSIVDWEKALEDTPYDDEELSPEFVKMILKQERDIRTGKEPIYHFEPRSFAQRLNT